MPNSTAEDFAQSVDLWGRLIRAANFALDNWWFWPLAALGVWALWTLRAHHALLGQLDERADAAFGDVDALLAERHALIGNLAQVVRACADDEHDMIRDVLDARVEALEALSGAGIQNETQIATVLKNVFTMSESYPKLASAEHYTHLHAELIRIEDRIVAARRFYNLAVEELNGVRRAFPGNLFAPWDGFKPREKFSLGERRAEMDQPAKLAL